MHLVTSPEIYLWHYFLPLSMFDIYVYSGALESGRQECGLHMVGRTPLWLNGPANPVELLSPNFPNAFNASNLECTWEVRARFGTQVSLV